MLRYSTFSFLIAALFALTVPAHCIEYGQTAQQFLTAQATPSAVRKPVRRVAAQPLIRASVVGFGGSWLERNLGASRPAGAPGPWCGYAMRLEVMSLGRPDPGPAYNAVRSWHNYGSPAPRAAVGSLFISAGHISKVVAHDCGDGRVRTISGNATARRVAYMCEPLSSLVVSRWP
ncbi:MAG: hypothetical protein IPK23_14825 [Rhizobiales bacterium]|nr:hypothetical protein [Hyphomicrobiales bacterium]